MKKLSQKVMYKEVFNLAKIKRNINISKMEENNEDHEVDFKENMSAINFTTIL